MNREILRLAIPNILSNLSIPLLSTVDTALMGRLSEVHIGAVGIASMIFNFVYWNFGFLRMGTTGITAQFFGRNARPGMILTLTRAALIALLLGLILLAVQWPLREAASYLLQVDESTYPHVATYFNIRIWAAPATLLLYAVMGWFFGMQNAVYPLILTVAINALNMVISYVLVFNYHLEIAGVAWGTVIAQYFGLLLAVVLWLIKYRGFAADLQRRAVLRWTALRRFLEINRDIFIRTLFLTFAFGFFYSQSSGFGEQILAVNVILLQFVNWLSYGIDGFAFATESIIGKYFGAGRRDKLAIAIRYNFLWALGMSALVALLYILFGEPLLRIFTDQPDVIANARPYLFWMSVFPLIAFACYIWDGVYVGLTASKAMRNSMALALLVFLLIYYPLRQTWGNHGLWMSFIIFLAARGVLQWIWFRRYGFDLS
ncbi:MAG: MATE family efflux transporter [Saprospiraceae bacterium]|nr:MATE family efflux transporter [Saprospiraceae bacterium]